MKTYEPSRGLDDSRAIDTLAERIYSRGAIVRQRASEKRNLIYLKR